ncbi:MAG: 50S ribosomal protein L9 [Alphaproteobacteria bacterium]|nr:50S ribosomal protein L9 [Alphaproteobacteria bacterium]
MDVILLERIEKLGQMGDVVKVRPGFARNFLLPQRKALRATKSNLDYFQSKRSQLEAQNLERRAEAEKVAAKMEGLTVVVLRQAGETGILYGSVSGRDIAEAVTTGGFSVDRGQVVLDKPIKTIGLHSVRVRLHPEVTVAVTANVARSEEEAKIQAERGEAYIPSVEAEAEAALDAEAEALERVRELEAEQAAAAAAAAGDAAEAEPEAAEPAPKKGKKKDKAAS